VVRELVGAAVAVMAVVKADAYGHGAAGAARAFVEAGAAALGVSTVDEGVELRRAALAVPVVVLGGVFAGEDEAVVAHDLAAAVWTVDGAAALGAAARRAGRRVALHLKVNTGMTRLGAEVSDVRALAEAIRRLDGVEIVGIFSHLASADEVDSPAARVQIARFEQAVAALAEAGIRPPAIHLANSAAVLAAPAAHFSMVRPGLMLYGYAPASHLGGRVTLRPALRLATRVAQVRAVPAATPVGYGGEYVTRRPSAIATLPIGYADGYHRLGWREAQVLVRGRRVPVAGRVCMDHTMIDVTDVAGIAAGEPVTLIGADGGEAIWADEVARWRQTIAYEVLTSIGRRVPRAHEEGPDA
jgi:alanine racemase